MATPLHDGRAEAGFVYGLIGAMQAGLVAGWITNEGESLVPRARNVLAATFLQRTDGTHLLWADSDIVWNAGHLRVLLEADVAVIGGMYRQKRAGGPWVWLCPDGRPPDEIGPDTIMPAMAAGTGFLLVSREAMEDVYAKAQTVACSGGGEYRDVFPCGTNGTLDYESEDWGFCRLLRAAGHGICVHQGVRLGHVGKAVYA